MRDWRSPGRGGHGKAMRELELLAESNHTLEASRRSNRSRRSVRRKRADRKMVEFLKASMWSPARQFSSWKVINATRETNTTKCTADGLFGGSWTMDHGFFQELFLAPGCTPMSRRASTRISVASNATIMTSTQNHPPQPRPTPSKEPLKPGSAPVTFLHAHLTGV